MYAHTYNLPPIDGTNQHKSPLQQRKSTDLHQILDDSLWSTLDESSTLEIRGQGMYSTTYWQQLEHSLHLKRKKTYAPTTVIFTFIVTFQLLLLFKARSNCTWDFQVSVYLCNMKQCSPTDFSRKDEKILFSKNASEEV